MTLKELYERGTDVKDFEVPVEWRESFDKFMFGSTCLADVDENGNPINFIYYYYDFRLWYHQNQEAIERDIKIDNIIK